MIPLEFAIELPNFYKLGPIEGQTNNGWTNGWTNVPFYTDKIDASENNDFLIDIFDSYKYILDDRTDIFYCTDAKAASKKSIMN